MSNVIPFDFDGDAVRVTMVDGEPWFVAKDVCRALDISNDRDAVGKLDADERDDVGITDTIGREQRTNVISESGLYTLISSSRKDEAVRFRKWVTGEVLPAIRRTGRYAAPEAAGETAPEMLSPEHLERPAYKAALETVKEARLVGGREAAAAVWGQLPMLPPLAVKVQDDPVGQFFDERIRRVEGERLAAADLYGAYLDWCRDKGRSPLTQASFGRQAATRAVKLKSGVIVYAGLAVA